MDDFLHNLRNGNTRRYDRPRRTYDGNQYSKHDNRRGSGNRPYPNNRGMMDPETAAAIRKSLEDISENQHRVIAVQERRAAAEERKADILESLGETLAALVERLGSAVATAAPAGTAVTLPAAETPCEPPVAAPDPPALLDDHPSASDDPAPIERAVMTREQLVAMIKALRADGMSYEKIANHLEENKVGTLSGRGTWRGQSVHRLFHE